MGIISIEHVDKMSLQQMQQTHEREINILNEIDQLAKEVQNDDEYLDDLENKIIQYIFHVKDHFKSEEDLMQEHGDPTYEQHKLAHDMFLADINYAKMIWDKSGDLDKILSVVRKAPEWLVSHVNTVDKPTAEFIALKTGQRSEQIEVNMSLEEIAQELEFAGVPRDKMNKLLSAIRRDGFDSKTIDKKLEVMGFAPVFTIYD